MNENEYFERIRNAWPKEGEASLSLIALADEATRTFPNSARLWCIRGNLIELGPEETPHDLPEALASYRRATEIDPTFAEAWEELGHYYDTILDDEAGAHQYFQRAESLRKKA